MSNHESTVGDWLLAGEDAGYLARGKLDEAATLFGIEYQTAAIAASTCRAWESLRRRKDLTFAHHREVANHPEADELLTWAAKRQQIADEANRKRSEAAKGQPRTPDGNRLAEKQVVQQSVEQPARRDKGNQARAAASKTNPGAVARGDKLARERTEYVPANPKRNPASVRRDPSRLDAGAVLSSDARLGTRFRRHNGRARPSTSGNPRALVHKIRSAPQHRGNPPRPATPPAGRQHPATHPQHLPPPATRRNSIYTNHVFLSESMQ